MTAQVSEEWLQNGVNYAAQLGLGWQPLSQAELQLLGSYSYNFGEPRYAGSGASSTDLVFGRLHAQSAGATLRASLTFIPALTLQTYAQLFFATGNYFDFTHALAAPAGSPPALVFLDQLVPGAPPPVSPDFSRTTLALNVVLRWEYRLGSTLYLVYVRSQNAALTLDPLQAPRLELGAFRDAPATDTFMIKLSYWFG